MSVSIIDGTLETITAKPRGRMVRLRDVTFLKADGTKESLPGLTIAAPLVAEALRPGTRGRFYLFKALDHKGIHAARPTGGRSILAFPRTNETLMAILCVINLVWVAATVVIREGVPLLGVALMVFTAVLFLLYRATRMEAERQVAADNPAASQ